MLDLRFEKPPVAEEGIRFGHVAGRQVVPDARGRNHVSILVLFALDDCDAKAVLGAGRAQVIRCALAGAAEVEVVAGNGMGNAERVDQNVLNERVGFNSCEVFGERAGSTRRLRPQTRNISVLSGGGVSRNTGLAGLNTVRGCGSKLIAKTG
jgi:hypothetical protein